MSANNLSPKLNAILHSDCSRYNPLTICLQSIGMETVTFHSNFFLSQITLHLAICRSVFTSAIHKLNGEHMRSFVQLRLADWSSSNIERGLSSKSQESTAYNSSSYTLIIIIVIVIIKNLLQVVRVFRFPPLFWVVTQRGLVVSYRRCGTTYRSYPQVSFFLDYFTFEYGTRQVVPKRRKVTTKLRWVTSQKSEDLKCGFSIRYMHIVPGLKKE
jgi:hypothetical protein